MINEQLVSLLPNIFMLIIQLKRETDSVCLIYIKLWTLSIILIFHYFTEIPETTTFSERKAYFGSQFWILHCMIKEPHCFGTLVKGVADMVRPWPNNEEKWDWLGSYNDIWGHALMSYKPSKGPHSMKSSNFPVMLPGTLA